MRRIAFVNEKGGTCKTTLAVNLAAWLAGSRRRVLLVDLDTQGHAGKSLGVDVRELRPNVYDLLLDKELPLARVARATEVENLDLVPANKALAELPLALAYDRERALRLDRRLAEAEGRWDYVVIDAPPSAGLFITQAMLAATDLVIPVATTYLALDGCAEIASTLDELHREHGRTHPRIAMVVPTLYRRTGLADQVIEKIGEHFPEAAAKTVLSQSVHLDECQSHGQTIFEYAPKSKGAQMIRRLGEELVARLEGTHVSPGTDAEPAAALQ